MAAGVGPVRRVNTVGGKKSATHTIHSIVGGSPAVREELAALEPALELRLVDGTERRTAEKAKADLTWADLILLWGASELHHKVSMLYSNAAPPLKKKVVHVAKRGIAALLSEAVTHLRKLPNAGPS